MNGSISCRKVDIFGSFSSRKVEIFTLIPWGQIDMLVFIAWGKGSSDWLYGVRYRHVQADFLGAGRHAQVNFYGGNWIDSWLQMMLLLICLHLNIWSIHTYIVYASQHIFLSIFLSKIYIFVFRCLSQTDFLCQVGGKGNEWIRIIFFRIHFRHYILFYVIESLFSIIIPKLFYLFKGKKTVNYFTLVCREGFINLYADNGE